MAIRGARSKVGEKGANLLSKVWGPHWMSRLWGSTWQHHVNMCVHEQPHIYTCTKNFAQT
jgi:hypothetical protein